jgi:predicted dehydrogenase
MPFVSSRRKVVSLGLVGTGTLWDQAYRPAIERCQHRVAVRWIYDAVPAKAEQAARECEAAVAPSLTSLFERPDVDAVLILDAAWYGIFPLQLACRFGKPTLLTGRWDSTAAQLEQVASAAREAGVMIMTAFPRRHTPAMNRLRELIVTKLGPPKHLHLAAAMADAAALSDPHLLGALLDWCAYTIGRSPSRWTASSPQECRIELEFPAAAGQVPPTAHIVFRVADPSAEVAEWESLHVECQSGSADIAGESVIAWRNGERETRDNLASERSSVDLILDQFCRRVVGGLVPVSDLADAARAWRFAEAVAEQWRTGP